MKGFEVLGRAKFVVNEVHYSLDDDKMTIIFRKPEAPVGEKLHTFTFNYPRAISNTCRFAREFAGGTILLYGEGIDIEPCRDPKTGREIDPTFEFLIWLGKEAHKQLMGGSL